MRNYVYLKIIFVILLFVTNTTCNANGNYTIEKDTIVTKKHSNKKSSLQKITSTAPKVQATSNPDIYCPGKLTKIVNTATLSDPSDVIFEIYIQISTGYINGQDILSLGNPSSHPRIESSSFDIATGKLKLFKKGATTLTDFEAAIKDVVFLNSSPTPSGIRSFSISIGNANYLPSTQHYYEFIQSAAITWTNAKLAAESKNYYGLQGYLATITSLDEVKITGEQATGSGWIGGSDEEIDDVWKWMTGPEKGTIFWNGKANGTSPNFAYWNSNEPNDYQSRGEKYAHITAAGVGIKGSWNDMTVIGDNSGAYQAKGYAIEYGGMPGDPILEISANTTLTLYSNNSASPNPICGSGSFNLSASTLLGTTANNLKWYDDFGNLLTPTPSNNYITPIITNTSTTNDKITRYYIDNGSCKTPIITTVIAVPAITSTTSPVYICGTGSEILQASPSIGTVNWFLSSTGGSSIATGTAFSTPTLSQDTTTTYFAEANNNSCVSTNRTPITITSYKLPDVMDEEVVLCKYSTVELDAKISGMDYLWSNNGGTNQTFTVSNPGIYSVQVTSLSPYNCSKIKKITVLEHEIPEIERIDITEGTVVIYLKKEETYFEYSIDGFNYQVSNTFLNVTSGLQTAYVREVNYCSVISDNFIVLNTPKFFTPNNDGQNDSWGIEGLAYYPEANITIFDRYGKFISELSSSKLTWDGMLNKTPLPADDYWYVLKFKNSKTEKRGHFSLKR